MNNDTKDGDFKIYSAAAIKILATKIGDTLQHCHDRITKLEDSEIREIKDHLSKMWALHDEQYKYNACIRKDFLNVSAALKQIESHLQKSCADFIIDLPIKNDDPQGIDHTVDLAIKEMLKND